MKLGIAGMGWVTPLGSGLDEVWARLTNGESANIETMTSPLSDRSYPVFRVPPTALAKAPAHPRLRRSSAISRFAVVAGLAALEDAQITLDAVTAERTAIIFAIANGGVVYTKRFYQEIVESGAQAASPLLFPETVFNAPASHLAAILGITGASYTLVGDGAVGILALKMAEDLMENTAIDRCLVVGAEEADWLLCDAYHRWRLLRSAAPIEVFEPKPRGLILSEGAGAVLLTSEGRASARPGHAEACPSDAVVIQQIDAGGNFRRQPEAAAFVEQVFRRLGANNDDLIIASANGTFVDQAERHAINTCAPKATIYSPKVSLGESVGASSLWQVICAAQALRTRQLPPLSHATAPARPASLLERAIVSTCGLNQQVAGLSLIRG
ncbi:MAG: hypothetical protein M3Y03_01650 [Verrucomicrobiota bacterium]|nr:hypothetical protein [Verrucomicrobiota bacterium]